MSRPPSQAARSKMLDATREILLDGGVRAVTFDEVASRSGVAKTTIYRHFDSKNALMVAALDGATPVPVTPDTGSLRGDLEAFLPSVLPIFADPSLRALFLDVLAGATRDPELAELQYAMLAGRAGPTMAIYEQARARGDLRPEIDYPTALEIIEGPFVFRALADPSALATIDLEVLIDRMLEQLTP